MGLSETIKSDTTNTTFSIKNVLFLKMLLRMDGVRHLSDSPIVKIDPFKISWTILVASSPITDNFIRLLQLFSVFRSVLSCIMTWLTYHIQTHKPNFDDFSIRINNFHFNLFNGFSTFKN
jgi:hypothetical protein